MLWVGVLFSSASLFGQTEEGRSLIVWVDTLDLSLCEGDSAFTRWGVWLASHDDDDTVVGFRAEDRISAFELTLAWDTSRVRLRRPYIDDPPQSLLGRFKSVIRSVDTNEGRLYVSAATDENLSVVVGQNIPLFYLVGRLPGKDEVDIPEAGARVQSLTLEGRLGDQAVSLRFLPGYVRRVADTASMATLEVTDVDLDTNESGVVSVLARNVNSNRVQEIELRLLADTSTFRFGDTISTAMPTGGWQTRDVRITGDTLFARFTSASELQDLDSVLLRVGVVRSTDSAFVDSVLIDRFAIGESNCIGKLEAINGDVRGAVIPMPDTTDTVTSVTTERVERAWQAMVEAEGETILIRGGGFVEAELFDISGQRVGQWRRNEATETWKLRPAPGLRSGVYLIVVRGPGGEIDYQKLIHRN